jgi:hypothetical protein
MQPYKGIIVIIFSFSFITLTVLSLPVLGAIYNPGVSVGQYVKYGNFVGSGQGFESFNEISFEQFQVTAVSGSLVTLLSTGQTKNGTALPGNGTSEVWDVTAGTLNGSPDVQGPIIAANLNQGDAIPPPNTYSVNSTEERTYLGVARAVNLLTLTIFTSDYNSTLSYIYDRQTGMLLEASNQLVTQSQPEPITSSYSYSAIETNIFNATPSPNPTTNFPIQTIIIIIAVIFVVVIVTLLVLLRKKL